MTEVTIAVGASERLILSWRTPGKRTPMRVEIVGADLGEAVARLREMRAIYRAQGKPTPRRVVVRREDGSVVRVPL